MTACACSGSPSPSSHPATAASTSHAPTFTTVSSGCVLPAQTVARLSGRNVSQAESIQMTLTTSSGPAHGCMYTGNEQGTSVLVGISLESTRPGATPQEYLAENRLAQTQTLLLQQQDVPGLGDAATFGTTTISGETIDVVSLVQIHQSTVADLSVTVSGSSVAEDSAIALARAVLAAIYH
jgi:hypothetical protein